MSHDPVHSEEDELPGHKIGLVLGGMVVLAFLWTGIAWWILARRESDLRPDGVFHERDLREPAIVDGVEQTLFDRENYGGMLEAEQRAVLGSYGWVDRGQGVVRIPIDQAIDVYVERSR